VYSGPQALSFGLELRTVGFYCRTMKRISLICAAVAMCMSQALRAQDAATEEKLNKLSGQIENLIEGQKVQQRHIETLAKSIETLREQMDKPSGNYASAEDLKRLADALKEVDRKRLEDYDKIRTDLVSIRKGLLSSQAPPKKSPPPPTSENGDSEKAAKPEKGFEYVVKQGQTLSEIVQAYRDKNIKVTTEQVLKANPGLKPEKLKPGQKIWIPAPQA
jgi:LysM repeat protein